MVVKNRKAERSQSTRAALIAAARALFAERGYAETYTDEVAQRAGVTRGALYHQYRDKEDLFRAVYEQLEQEFEQTIASQLRTRLRRASGAWEQVKEGAQAFLDASLDPEIQRIALLEAPAVLGWGASRDLARFGLDLIRQGIERAIDEGLVAPQPIEPLARVLRAAISEAALYIARAEDHASARAEVGAVIERLIDGFRAARR